MIEATVPVGGSTRLTAHRLDLSAGRRFALLHEPATAPRGLVVHVHAFAEELNKSRRMIAMQARALAGDGWAVLVPDLLGCGDSDGEFGDATWTLWERDVVESAAWLASRHPRAPETWLWGHRAGCLLAGMAAAQMNPPPDLLLWQPTHAGSQHLRQFLRLKAAADLSERGGTGVVAGLRAKLGAGDHVEVAGYRIGPGLAAGLEGAVLDIPAGCRRVVCLEVHGSAGSGTSPATQSRVDAWRQRGTAAEAWSVPGPAFWQTVEIEEAPALIAATSRALAARPMASTASGPADAAAAPVLQ